MTAVITTSRWNAIDPNYKTGSPSDGTAGILRLTTDKGTVLVGDWGTLSADDHDANDEAVRNGERILSAYDLGSTRLWIITGAETEGPVGPRACVHATPPLCCCPPSTDPTELNGASRHRGTTMTDAD